MDKGKDVINYVFQKIGVNAQAVETAIQNEMSHLPKVSGGEPYLSSETNQVMQRTVETSPEDGVMNSLVSNRCCSPYLR